MVRGVRLGIFGTFHPEYNYTGNVTTALAIGLSRIETVDRVVVFCQYGATLPEESSRDPIELVSCWVHNSALSLMAAGRQIIRSSRDLDAMLFNTYVTAYGRSKSANAVGLSLPTTIARLSRIPTFVYMHNFVETQDVVKLGYSPSRPVRWLVHELERSLLRTTNVIVPLRSQAERVSQSLGSKPQVWLFPFLESYLVAASSAQRQIAAPTPGPLRAKVLLMGSWGPQKELMGGLQALEAVLLSGQDLEITVAGGANVNFPGYLSSLISGLNPLLRSRTNFAGALPDVELFQLVLSHDLLVLPYRTTGGYSGVMNFASLAGIPIVAYDNIQLREQASVIAADVTFTSSRELVDGIRSVLSRGTDVKARNQDAIAERRRRTEQEFSHFASFLCDGIRRAALRNGKSPSKLVPAHQ
jgi:glycosyltransferase involved in cell wall biosynthesis